MAFECQKCNPEDYEIKSIYGPLVKERRFKFCNVCGKNLGEVIEEKDIIGVAVKQGDLIICLPKPNRHHDCIHYACKVLKLTPPIAGPAANQGFYLADGTFLNRKDGLEYAKKNDLLINKQAHAYLFSEDLW